MKRKTHYIALFPIVIVLLIEVILGYALNSLQESFFCSIEKIISYKWLLILFLLLFLSFLLILYYYFKNIVFCKTDNSNNINAELNNDNKTYKENKSEISEEDKINIGKKYLKTLSEEEKEILRRFFDNNKKTQRLRLQSGVVQGLQMHNIIFPASNISTRLLEVDFNVEDWAWEYLNKNPHLLR